MDLTNINKNLYIENTKKLYNEEFTNKISYLFKIIEVFNCKSHKFR